MIPLSVLTGEKMLDSFSHAVAPYYLYVKFVHVCAVTLWAWSTSVAYYWYVRAAYIGWRKNPDNPEMKRRKDWALEQFDNGVVIEHVAFPVALVTGLTMFFVGGWDLDRPWLKYKLAIILFIFVPMEIIDIWLSHFGGKKEQFHGDPDRYEGLVRFHWKFFSVVTPLVGIFIPTLIFLAVVKP